MSFRLTKWYLDCTSAAGEAAIAYWARLELGGVSVAFASLLELRGEGPAVSATSLLPVEAPRAEGERHTWRCEALGFSGAWTALAPPLPAQVLLDMGEGAVRWECRQPLARVALATPRGALEGLGYVELLTLTARPWQMPIDELRWGRFVSDGASLVWVDWRGPHARRVVKLDGVEVKGASIDDDGVVAPGLRLRFDDRRLLRRGALARTALAAVPGIERLAPLRMLATEEIKWVSPATLERPSGPVVGQAIFEVVRWPAR